MKKIIPFFILILLLLFSIQGCQKDQDDVIVTPVGTTANLEVQNFIWKGLNQYYLWQADVPNLADNRFANQTALDAFLVNYKVPKDLDLDAYFSNYTKEEFLNYELNDDFTLIAELFEVTGKLIKKITD